MASVTSRPSGDPLVGDIVTLADEAAGSRVELAPARGALVTSFRARGRELLYLDEATLRDASKSVRGGIPVLFPFPGKLADDAYRHGDRTFTMKQHGFARTLPWTVVSKEGTPAASVTLELSSSPATLSQYPWPFRATLTFSLSGVRLRLALRVENLGGEEMPYGLGYHPYFAVKDKAGARIETRATRAFDNVTKETGAFHGFDLTRPEVDLHLCDHGSTESALTADGARLSVRGSSEFTRWVVWTLAGKPFVCVEPWTCPGNALNTGEGLIHVAPGGAHESWIEVAAENAP
jgi:galactose mutarotase-like enzyme